jgi:hypothetical protein
VAGKEELFYRRVGASELDAIQICRGYVEAQYRYAMQPREGYAVNQYAQRVISTSGKQDSLAWQKLTELDGPIGERSRTRSDRATCTKSPTTAIAQDLKSRGPAAPMGKMDFVVKGVMIGGFAGSPLLHLWRNGIKSFIVGHDGVVYEGSPE